MTQLPNEYLREFYLASVSLSFWLHNKQEVQETLEHYDECIQFDFQQTISPII